MFAAVTPQPIDVVNAWYLVIAVIPGFITIASALFVGARYVKRYAVREAKIDELVGNAQNPGVKKLLIDYIATSEAANEKRNVHLDSQDREIALIKRQVTPNGGNTQMLGDIAKRSEGKVDALITTVATQDGANKSDHASIWRAINELKTVP